MAQLQNYGASSWKTLVVAGIFLSQAGCSVFQTPEPEVQVVKKVEKTTVPLVARPKPVQLSDTRVYVVTKENLDGFLANFKSNYGEVAFVVLSMKDYENLALNIADIRRYINQQTQVIVYYEASLKPEDIKEDK